MKSIFNSQVKKDNINPRDIIIQEEQLRKKKSQSKSISIEDSIDSRRSYALWKSGIGSA
jgi:hypothetical protein